MAEKEQQFPEKEGNDDSEKEENRSPHANKPETRNSMTIEEIVLYGLSFIVFIGISSYMYHALSLTSKPPVEGIVLSDLSNLQLDDKKMPIENFMELQFLRAQLQLVHKRYETASRLGLTNAYIKYAGFMIGAFMCMLGTIVIFKGVTGPVSSNANIREAINFKITTSGPGAFIVFLGAIIIIATIVIKAEVEVIDPDLREYGNSNNGSSSFVIDEVEIVDDSINIFETPN